MPDFYPQDSEPEDIVPDNNLGLNLCSDPNCIECHPEQENEVEIPRFLDSRTITTNTTSDPIDRLREIITEGENVPENTPEASSEENPNTPVIPTVPRINGVTFATGAGSVLRVGSDLSQRLRSGITCSITLWDMRPEQVRNSFIELKSWMAENNIGISSGNHDYYQEDNLQANVYYYLSLFSNERNGVTDPAEFLSQPPCECGEEVNYPTLKCPSCDNNLYCSTCRIFSDNVSHDRVYGTCCTNCGITCEEESCGILFSRNARTCPACNPRVRCSACQEIQFVGENNINTYAIEGYDEDFNYCDSCFECLCHTCNTVVAVENILEDQGHSCTDCVSRTSSEEWSDDSLDTPEILIPTIPGREVIRLVGMEIEGANGENVEGHDGGEYLARALYEEGVSRAHSMTGYHSSDGSRMTIHVERDSSVDWELVIGPMNVADSGQVDLMNRSVKVVRRMINDGTLKLDMRAGMHVHVAADRVPFHSAYNLHKIYMYMEDFLYRFGAAKWPYHRSVNRRGRDQAGKSPIAEGKLHFARTFAGNRYYGLSFDNYFARYFEGCGCGARTYGLFDECTCELGKCTFEFRLFNTTANTVKIHAYLAICQALVAKAIELDEITDSREYPALDFTKTRASDLHPSTRSKLGREWEKRIVFVNEQLPLTSEEKKSIHYCIMNSEIGKIATNADILLETEDN